MQRRGAASSSCCSSSCRLRLIQGIGLPCAFTSLICDSVTVRGSASSRGASSLRATFSFDAIGISIARTCLPVDVGVSRGAASASCSSRTCMTWATLPAVPLDHGFVLNAEKQSGADGGDAAEATVSPDGVVAGFAHGGGDAAETTASPDGEVSDFAHGGVCAPTIAQGDASKQLRPASSCVPGSGSSCDRFAPLCFSAFKPKP